MAVKDLRNSPTMKHLLDALERGEDIGHYGRLTFAMAAHHFMEKEELVKLLMKGGDTEEAKARALVEQVTGRDYNPPSRQRLLEWQSQQEFPICPNPDDPNACNLYRELEMPDEVYEDIAVFWEETATAQ
jgi:DNA primase large subunit